ncbi:uncharacterized protein LOC123671354 [Harmonia axyridis]|uniref:uncharacterized protein LOC123671354 n=1 Tax=Harmonia axyridis TaxID=115357 RepID=UPI001E277D54|nr:uncharacterized protein LOC123671354 [Harmonia axyridis]
MKVNMAYMVHFLSCLLLFEVALSFTLDEYDKNFDETADVEVFEDCRESTPFPMDIRSNTVNPIFIRPNPHLTNYIPPKPKNGGRPKVIPNSRTFMPRVHPFPYPRRISVRFPTNTYFYSTEGPFFRIWRTRWVALQ